MKTLKIVAILLVVVGLAAVGGRRLFTGDGHSAAAAQESTPTAKVTRGNIEETISATGSVIARREAKLVFGIGGRVREVLVQEGQRVAAGELLIRLDSSDLEWQVARAEAALTTAQARLKQASLPASPAELAQQEARLAQAKRSASEAELAAAQATVNIARANLTKLLAGPSEYDLRAAKLNVDSARNQLWSVQAQRDSVKGSRASSQAQKDAAEAQVLIAEVAVQQASVALEKLQAPPRAEDIAVAQAQLAQAEAQLAQLKERPRPEDVALAEAQLAQLQERPRPEDVAVVQAQVDEAALALEQARDALADAELTAPFAGAVIDVVIHEGEWASPGAPVVYLTDADDLLLEVMVDEADIAQVREGQRVVLSFDALPKEKVLGHVASIAPSATQTSRGVAYRVEAAFEAGELPIRLGMTAKVDIVTAAAEDALLVPNRAIRADRAAGRYYVTRKTALGSEEVEVQIGLRDDTHTQITGGLQEGDTVLLQTVDLTAPTLPPFMMQAPRPPTGGRR